MTPNIIEFATDAQLLGLSISEAQETLLRAFYGLPLSKAQLDIFQQCTGREEPPQRPIGEVTVIAGARSGKDSRIAAPVLCYEAIFGGHEKHLHRGERGTLALVAQDTRGAKIAFGYIRDYVTGSRLLSSKVVNITTNQIVFDNGMSVVCYPCTLRSLRGWSIPAACMDELGFWKLEGQADADTEVQTSIRRGGLSFPNPKLVKISTPFHRAGLLYEDNKLWGQDDPDRLVWKASTVLMNPSVAEARLARERRLDPARFSREYEAEFATDLDAFLDPAWIESAIAANRFELPPQPNISYAAAVDPSGGGAAAFTLSILHTEGPGSDRVVVQDVMKAWRRTPGMQLDLEAVVKEIASVLRRYKVSSVIGDRYSAEWVRQSFQRAGLRYEHADHDRSAAYLELQPLFAQGRIEILDNSTLVRELKLLEARMRAGGKIIVDHPRGAHDDYANALALAAAKVAGAAGVSMTELAAGWAQHSDDGLAKDLEPERRSAAYSFESRWVDVSFEGRDWRVAR